MAKFKVGDRVRVIVPQDKTPEYSWGYAKSGDEGVIKYINSDNDIFVDFPSQSYWTARPEELQNLSRGSKKECPLPRNKLYAVVHEDRPSDFLLVTADRELARSTKVQEGGKESGIIILQFAAKKEIR